MMPAITLIDRGGQTRQDIDNATGAALARVIGADRLRDGEVWHVSGDDHWLLATPGTHSIPYNLATLPGNHYDVRVWWRCPLPAAICAADDDRARALLGDGLDRPHRQFLARAGVTGDTLQVVREVLRAAPDDGPLGPGGPLAPVRPEIRREALSWTDVVRETFWDHEAAHAAGLAVTWWTVEWHEDQSARVGGYGGPARATFDLRGYRQHADATMEAGPAPIDHWMIREERVRGIIRDDVRIIIGMWDVAVPSVIRRAQCMLAYAGLSLYEMTNARLVPGVVHLFRGTQEQWASAGRQR